MCIPAGALLTVEMVKDSPSVAQLCSLGHAA